MSYTLLCFTTVCIYNYLSIYLSLSLYIYMYTHIYIYIHREREREQERSCTYIYIYIYTYILVICMCIFMYMYALTYYIRYTMQCDRLFAARSPRPSRLPRANIETIFTNTNSTLNTHRL